MGKKQGYLALISRAWPAALFCGTLILGGAGPLIAQDLTLTLRDGALSVVGTLISYDGEFYRLSSEFGPLTITADSVICDGPACPDLMAPKSVIRLTGDAEAAAALLPPLISAFADARGFDLRAPASPNSPTQLLQAGSDIVLAEFYFTTRAPEAARTALAEVDADLVVARFAPAGSAAKVLALDALVPIASPENPIAQVSTADLAAALSGRIDNWSKIGGPDMPLVLHGLDAGSDLVAALAARLGDAPAPARSHRDLAALAAAVAADPWALAMTGRASLGSARALPLTDSCGFVLDASALSVKAEDYPLTLPVYLLTPQRRLPFMAQDFLDFLSLPVAQSAIAAAGFVARDFETQPLSLNGGRLINAIKAAKGDADLSLLQRLAQKMDGAQRASITFRFEDGGANLDLVSQNNLADLALRIAAGQFTGADAVLVGFVAGTPNADDDIAASMKLAETVLAELMPFAPDLPAESWPSIDGFGSALPMACDTTAAGKRLNMRVELWLRPAAQP